MSPSVKVYALTTCIHCKNAKKFLDDNGVSYDVVHVDTLTGDEKKAMVEEVKSYNQSCSFPTILIGDKVVVGFRREEIKEALGL